MPPAPQFLFDDAATFEENIASYSAALVVLDAKAGPALVAHLRALEDESTDKSEILSGLFTALQAAGVAEPAAAAGPQAAPAPVPKAFHWFLEGLEVEGFRGINNEGSPLQLKFKPDCVNSVSAPNAVGKSSLYDALCFALRGKVDKLERLLQAERPQDYYLNRFHSGATGTVTLIVRPDDGGPAVSITIKRSSIGVRTVTATGGVDGEALLAELNREFVLLDGKTFRDFIDDKALERGRSFAGLLGLARYAILRRQLQALANTRSFNTHFETAMHATTISTAERTIAGYRAAISKDYAALVKEAIAADASIDDAQQRCHGALAGSPVLTPHCTDRAFIDVDLEACMGAVRAAEGGPKRDRLVAVMREQEKLAAANKPLPAETDLTTLADLAQARDDALSATSGEKLHQLYQLSEQIMGEASWPSPTLCPTCGKDDGSSVLDDVREKLGKYASVVSTTQAVTAEWVAKGWGGLEELEKLTLHDGEAPSYAGFTVAGRTGTIATNRAKELAAYVVTMRTRAAQMAAALTAERTQLERELPPSLVAVTTAVEAARRLQGTWKDLSEAERTLAAEKARDALVKRLKTFLDNASSTFATADSAMAASRLQKVEPVCRDFFKGIMFSPVVPALQKPEGSEEIGIRLAEFWGLKDLSAQALLSESYRNAFAISVYLAAASLYGGAPRFIVLDDVTSSLDAGHQHHLMELIRTKFARPALPDGPQVIIFSHDTMLEKLFNRHSNSAAWSHQRLEGNARTAVLPQSGAVNKVRDATIDLLQAGRTEDAAPRIRQYLEYVLQDIIDRCRIPVPLDLAFGDDKRTPGEFLSAIDAAVKLNQKAGTLVLDQAQVQALQNHSTAIVANYLSHWSTGQTQAFAAPALLGVMQAIDDIPDCFKYMPAPGAPKKFYASLNKR
jgi:recombinational DNA repair ATPase RecF